MSQSWWSVLAQPKSKYVWKCHFDVESGKPYYEALKSGHYLGKKGDVQWERPFEPVEPYWIANLDLKSGKIYYEDIDTKMIQWERPNEFHDDQNKWMAEKDSSTSKYFYTNIANQTTQWEIPKCFQTKLEKEWKRHFDIDSKQNFYENVNTEQTTWTPPKDVEFDENGDQIISKLGKLRRPPKFLDEEDYALMKDLVNGYVKELFLKYGLNGYPSDLTNIFIQFIGIMFIRFDIYPKEHDILIKNGGRLIRKWGQTAFTVACSKELNHGVHEIKIKCKCFGAPSVIGITTNHEQYVIDGFWCGDTNGLIYAYYSPDIMVPHESKQNAVHVISQSNLPELREGCIVILVVNIDRGKLTMNIDEYSHCIDIKPRQTYYFFMGLQSHYCQYEILR